MNAGKRIYPHQDSGAGVWHCFSRIIDRSYLLDDPAKDFFLKTLRAYEDLLGVEVLTFCLMTNHFHLLVRVPPRPEGLDVPLDVILARMERAVGEHAMKLIRRDLGFWETTGNHTAIEDWRQRQMKRMYSLSDFIGCVKQRFTRWHNAKTGRRGTIWEERFGSVVVEEEERALRTMAAYIDLNPVRAGMVEDPADYRWSGYAKNPKSHKSKIIQNRMDNAKKHQPTPPPTPQPLPPEKRDFQIPNLRLLLRRFPLWFLMDEAAQDMVNPMRHYGQGA